MQRVYLAVHRRFFKLSCNWTKKGDEVLVPNQTHVSTISSCEIIGAKPVFIDSDSSSGNIDIDKIEKKLTSKTKAITVVHFLGKPVNMDKIIKIKKVWFIFNRGLCAKHWC